MPFKKGVSGNPKKQFSTDNQPENRGGRRISIKHQLKALLDKDGKTTIEAKDVIKINEDGSIIIKLPTQMKLALKLQRIASKGSSANTLKAIQMIMEQLDGKPRQALTIDTPEDIKPSLYKVVPPNNQKEEI